MPHLDPDGGIIPTVYPHDEDNPEDPHGFRPFRRYINRSESVPMQYDRSSARLIPFLWPVYEDNQRVPPQQFAEYRRTHQFRNPGCMCASLDTSTTAYTETVVTTFTINRGLNNLWVARCSTGMCKYFLYLEKYYVLRDLQVKNYPCRDVITEVDILPERTRDGVKAVQNQEGPRPVVAVPTTAPATADPTNGAVNCSVNGSETSILSDTFDHRNASARFMKLNCQDDPGLSEEEFHAITMNARLDEQRSRQALTL
ncbi:uncharacterized protein LAESUDRAFT_763481 [Laetiporus sulphureus 93-53]|uniref:Uncharacterized protein n=1 Tax=Laetiporus sulphureus 93-53 TaxID=1314785 RepID=A0A165BVS4_9APHY|nr:uncharacterized protein LAESUDRAFT_763481 [Laetiporus sulphureus 93-53]KZT01742.1 hypothetical protein LAESUDRAFT_763481 [Laetiporus sulphureus 93-53]